MFIKVLKIKALIKSEQKLENSHVTLALPAVWFAVLNEFEKKVQVLCFVLFVDQFYHHYYVFVCILVQTEAYLIFFI